MYISGMLNYPQENFNLLTSLPVFAVPNIISTFAVKKKGREGGRLTGKLLSHF
jgi:hypothetical protein